ncbi:MAG: HNH endonuclease signature motif containing protein, partial [Acidobacteria bacterium]|nr:HNH endonuclease signature motif containing protein [Acidobacteriota bacterium]
ATFGQRQADALGLIAESALAAELDRGAAGDRYQVVLHVDADTLRGDAHLTGGRRSDRPCGDARDVSAETPPNGAAPAAVDAGDVPAETPPTPPAGVAPAAGDAGDVPAATRSPGHAALEDADGLRVSAETSRRIACEASAVVMRHAADGAILDVGRKTRTIPPALGRALRARDRGCRFPGCTARRCDAHHVRHWADGGATRLDNLVLLCRRHHRAVHEEGFRVEVDSRGEVAFRWPDGRPFPAAPATPRWTGPALAPSDARLAAAGIAIGPATATPRWHGERLDLGYAIDVLWTPRAG